MNADTAARQAQLRIGGVVLAGLRVAVLATPADEVST